jgi:hypothetical protein
VKLPPPEIKLPMIKIPKRPPHIKVPSEPKVETPKKSIGIKSIEDVQSRIENTLEKLETSPILEKIHDIEEEPLDQKKDEKTITEIPKQSESIIEILEESDFSSKPHEPPKFTEMPEKPKKRTLVPEIIEVESEDEEKTIPFTIEKPDLFEEPSAKESEFIGKSPVMSKPKFTEVSIEEIEAEEIHSTGTELFNVFSSVGEKSAEKIPTLDESLTPTRSKKKKKEEKSDAIAFVGFNDSKPEIRSFSKPEAEIEDTLPSDKDSLYQELIALEGKRYSLEKSFKDIEKYYSSGSIDDSEYKKQSDELRGKLNGITSKINRIRRVISSI